MGVSSVIDELQSGGACWQGSQGSRLPNRAARRTVTRALRGTPVNAGQEEAAQSGAAQGSPKGLGGRTLWGLCSWSVPSGCPTASPPGNTRDANPQGRGHALGQALCPQPSLQVRDRSSPQSRRQLWAPHRAPQSCPGRERNSFRRTQKASDSSARGKADWRVVEPGRLFSVYSFCTV